MGVGVAVQFGVVVVLVGVDSVQGLLQFGDPVFDACAGPAQPLREQWPDRRFVLPLAAEFADLGHGEAEAAQLADEADAP